MCRAGLLTARTSVGVYLVWSDTVESDEAAATL